MKSLIYPIALFIAFLFISENFGLIAAILAALVALGVLLYGKRAAILAYFASQAYFVKGDKEKAYNRYQAAYNTGIMKPSGKVAFAAFCLYTDKLERCRRLLNEVANSSRSTGTDVANAEHYLAILEWKEGNLEEAISLMEKVHGEYPSTGTYASLGAFYLEKAKSDNTHGDYLDFMLEAYEYNESDKTIADNLGEVYLNIKEYEKAKEVYDKLLSTAQISPVPYYNYARVLIALGKTDEAKENLEKALQCRFTRTLTITREEIEEELNKLN